MKKILIFGGTGGLGRQLINELNTEYKCISLGSNDCDVSQEIEVKNILTANTYDAIIFMSVKNIDGLIHKQTLETIDSQLKVSVTGFLNVLRYCTEHFRNQKFGRVIYISSVLSQKPIRGTGIYSAAKAFNDNLIKTYSLENSKYGITANSIQLGYFEGGLTDTVPENVLEQVKASIPLKRLGRVEELARVVDTIMKTEYINGANISMAGGYENE